MLLKSGDVDAMQENPLDGGIGKAAAAGDFETSAGSIAAAEPAAKAERHAVERGDLLQKSANRADVGGVHQRVKNCGQQVRTGRLPQIGLESGVGKLQGAVRGKNGDDFPGGV